MLYQSGWLRFLRLKNELYEWVDGFMAWLGFKAYTCGNDSSDGFKLDVDTLYF